MINEFGGDYIQWLRGFYFVARTGNVSEAARILCRRQPTISQQIKNLEEHFNVILFDRSKGRMALTPDGRKLLKHSISVFENVKEISNKLRPKEIELKDKITIASTHALIIYYLAPYVTSFYKKNKKVSFELVGGLLDVIKESINLSTADFGVAFLDEIETQYDTRHLFTTSLSLIASKGNKFRIHNDISIPEIASLPFVGYPPASTIHSKVQKRFQQEGCKFSTILKLYHFEPVKTFVKLDFGVSIIFDYALQEKDKTQLQIIPLRHYFGDISIGTISLKKKYMNHSVQAFLAELTKKASP